MSLIKTHRLSHSRSLVFFLCADDSMFEERKNAEAGVVGNFLGKIKRGVLPAEDWGVDTERKIKVDDNLSSDPR
jgi:hypothetical protein